ncbi:MAG: TIGR04282 family arsenosugar biosynthesis glycosyltransferase [Verrucomicrobiota bacterium]
MMEKRVVLVFLKYPEAGRVKTRLAVEVGDGEAVRIYGEMVGRVLGLLAGLEGVSVWVCFDPAERADALREWVGGLVGDATRSWEFLVQAGGDLGERMRAAVSAAKEAGFGRVVVVGTDCVELTGEVIGQAWDLLDETDVVFGPATDGGYYLVGMTEVRAVVFEGIEWSTERTLEMSVAAARGNGLSVGLLRELRDVDTYADWESANFEC